MKKTMVMVLMGLVSLTLSGCGVVRSITCINKEKLALFNWGEYIDPAVIRGFENEYDVCVNMSTFASNESAITKMKTQAFDLVIPSDYAIEQMVSESLIQTIDWSKITTFDPTTDLAPGLAAILDEIEFDLLDYGVPYFWGNVGILYNTDTVSKTELESLEWDIFKSNSYDIAFYDSARDGFMVALKSLGFSMNTSNQTELNAAESWLMDLANHQNVVFLTDEILDDMVSLTYDLALTYSGDAIYLMSEQSKLDFFVPNSGTNVWADAMVIPNNAKNVDLAYAFINYVLTQEAATLNTSYVMYSSPRKDVYEAMVAEDGDFYDYRSAYNVVIHPNDEVFQYVPATKAFITDAWARVRAV